MNKYNSQNICNSGINNYTKGTKAKTNLHFSHIKTLKFQIKILGQLFILPTVLTMASGLDN